MARRNLVVSLDIGTTKTLALVGKVSENHSISVVGIGITPSRGLKKGSVVNIDEVVSSIDQALERAERMSGIHVTGALVGMTGTGITSMNSSAVVAVTGEDSEVTEEDVRRVVGNSQFETVPEDCSVLHAIPRKFTVDGCGGIRDPQGMIGARLEVETHIVAAATTSVQNVVKSVRRAGIKPQGLVANPLAAAEAVLRQDEKDLGVLLVDIGGGTTGISLFESGSPLYTSVLPVGGDHITSDLAMGLRVSLAEAERIKTEHGCVLAGLMSRSDTIETASPSGQRFTVSRQHLASIIEPRFQEILNLVRQEIQRSEYRGMLPGGMVITGGNSVIDGIIELAQEEMRVPVRLGSPPRLGGISEAVSGPAYAAGIGLLIKAARSHQVEMSSGDPLLGGLLGRIKSWWRDLA
ncbi:MAG: cell division protein FtsA [Firmicutes bacterium]|nr:cell division protein FtsA [Bacillota bacterium]